MIFLPLETELFYYEHLLDSSDNLQLIQDFCVTNTSGYGLERYIKKLGKAVYTWGETFYVNIVSPHFLQK